MILNIKFKIVYCVFFSIFYLFLIFRKRVNHILKLLFFYSNLVLIVESNDFGVDENWFMCVCVYVWYI
jgi:hypothetical protein